MLGNLVGSRSWLAALLVLASSCAHNVPQDSNTGADGKEKGAKSITLENGEGRTSGIVTYPGGDRIDWKLVELPEKQRGTLDIQLAWTPPRSGLQLAFDVFDEWNRPIVQSQKSSKKAKGRTRSATVQDARGKYLIRVYAVNRGDAGKYRLTVDFKEATSGPGFDPLKLEIPDPPKLAAVPDVVPPCDPLQFDPKNPECRNVCPDTGAPPNWPACKDKCPTPPDANNPVCQKTMDCPNPPDARVLKCLADKEHKWPKCPDPRNPDLSNPNCVGIKIPPVVGRIINSSISGNEVIVTIGAGSNSGIAADWTAHVLNGSSQNPLAGGDIKVIRVDKQVTVGKTKLTPDQLLSNPRVKLSAP
jgi:hypothetical protein